MKTLYFLILLVFTTAAEAQHIEHFYNWQWRPSTIAEARFMAVIDKKDSLWERKDYFIHEKSLQMKGSYTDSACKIAHGKFHFFHPNKSLQSTGEFKNGKKQGIWIDYYSNGMISDSANYNNGTLIGTTLSWHPNGYLSDSSVYNADGSGVSVGWFDTGVPARAGKYSSGYKKTGKWQYFHKSGNLSANEIYENDKLIDKNYFDEQGNVISDTTSRDKEALFKGGKEGWQKFILNQLYFPTQYKIVNADKAIVVVAAAIDEEGNMTDVEVHTPFYPDFDRIAVAAIKKSPKWTPAVQHNRKVKYKILQAVIFQQETED